VAFPCRAGDPFLGAADFLPVVSVVLLMCFRRWINEYLDLWRSDALNSRSHHQSIYPYIQSSSFLCCGRCRGRNKKPTTVSSRGLLSKFCLTTSANGVVSYDDQQSDLSNIV
jgi:hypothetical protein